MNVFHQVMKGTLEMFYRLRRFTYDNWYFFACHFISCIGLIASPVTIIAAVNPNLLLSCNWIWYLSLGIPIFYSGWRIKPRKSITINLARRRTITVRQGNIWNVKKGIVVIPVNKFLDTQVDDVVIGKGTIHGQFIKRYKEMYPAKDLDAEIINAIQADRLQKSGTYKNRKHVNGTHEDAYPLGEVVRLKEGDLQYYLVVATEFDEDNHVINQPEKYSMVLMTLIKKIDRWNSGVPVFLPIIGSGQMGLSLTKQEVVTEILSCFNLAEHYVANGGTTILVCDNDMKELSLNKIKYQFSKI